MLAGKVNQKSIKYLFFLQSHRHSNSSCTHSHKFARICTYLLLGNYVHSLLSTISFSYKNLPVSVSVHFTNLFKKQQKNIFCSFYSKTLHFKIFELDNCVCNIKSFKSNHFLNKSLSEKPGKTHANLYISQL